MFTVDNDGVVSEFVAVGSDVPRELVPFLRTPYNYDRDAASDASGLDCSDMPSMAQQQFKDETDINTIVRNFGVTGQLPAEVAVPQSGDFTDVVDFHTAMNVVRASEEAFMLMPADVRKRFGNDPGEFLAFVHDDENRDEARKLGLLVPEPVIPPKEVIDVRVVPQTAIDTSST